MGWTAPASGTEFAVAEIVTAAKLNAKVTDNLRYLKGSDGPVQIDNTIASLIAAGGASVEAQGTSNNSNARFRLLAKQSGGTVVDWRIFANALSGVGEFSIYDTTAAAERLRIDNAGNVGIGTSAPQGILHAFAANGGCMLLSAAAVTSLQTLAVAGTVTQRATFFVSDQNNTGGATVNTFLNLTVNSLLTYTNNDTITVAVTAGGAITVQRTIGTNGTHDIILWVLYV